MELNWAGEIEVPVAREGARVVGIWVMVGVAIELVGAISEDGESTRVLVVNEDMSIEMTVVWLAD